MHAEKCPVCNGTGKFEGKQCHGCAGLGWVTVQDGYPIYYPMPQPCYPEWPKPWESPFCLPNTTTYYPDNDVQWEYTNAEFYRA